MSRGHQQAQQGAASAAPVFDEAALDSIADRVAGRIEVRRDQGVQAPKGLQVEVRRPQGFYEEIRMETGRVFKLRGCRNDEAMVRQGWLIPFTGKPLTCRACGSEFSSETNRERHGRNAHEARESSLREVPLTPPSSRERTTYSDEDVARERSIHGAVASEVERAEANERVLDAEAPLYMDKTAASQKG